MSDKVYTLEQGTHFSIGVNEDINKNFNNNRVKWDVIGKNEYISHNQNDEGIEAITEAWDQYINLMNNKASKTNKEDKDNKVYTWGITLEDF